MKNESRLGRAASGKTQGRDPRPPSCTGGTKIARAGRDPTRPWLVPLLHATGNTRPRQARCANISATLPRNDKWSKNPNKIVLGRLMLNECDHLVGPTRSVVDS